MYTYTYIGEGNGTPLQYSCLEDPMGGGAWWVAVHGVAKSRTRLSDLTFTFHFSLSCIGKGNGNPLQSSCLENPRDGGAWWAAVYGVAQSRTRLKRLRSSSSSSIHIHALSLFAVHLKLTCCESYTSVKNKINPLSSIQFFSALSSFHSFPLRLSPKHNFPVTFTDCKSLQFTYYIFYILH